MKDDYLAAVAASLSVIAECLKSQQISDGLGFQESSGKTIVYCNPSDGKGWYTLGSLDSQGVREQVYQPSYIKGFVTDLKFVNQTRRNKDVVKMHLCLSCGSSGEFILESGSESCFTRSVLAIFAAVVNLEVLRSPLTIFSYLSESQESLFASITMADGSKPKLQWNNESDWRAIAAKAKRNIYLALGREKSVDPPQVPQQSGRTWSPPPISNPAYDDSIPF